MADPIGAQFVPGGDHLLMPAAQLQTYAQKRVSGNGIAKVRLGSLR